MRDAADLIRAVAWPVVALIFLFVLRPEWKNILLGVARRIETAKKMTVGPRGVAIEGVIDDTIPPELQARQLALVAILRQIREKHVLDQVARAMNVEISANITRQRNTIAAAIRRIAKTESDMSRLEADIGLIIDGGDDHG